MERKSASKRTAAALYAFHTVVVVYSLDTVSGFSRTLQTVLHFSLLRNEASWVRVANNRYLSFTFADEF